MNARVGDREADGVAPRSSAASTIGTHLSANLVVPLALFLLLAVVPMFVAPSSQTFVLTLVTRIMIFALAAMALDLLIGYAALISFGHAAYFGLGAYAVAIPSSFGLDNAFLQLVLALVASGFFALVTGAISLRTKGTYFILISLAFGQMLYFFGSSLAVFGGDDGMALPSRSLVAGHSYFSNERVLYYVCFVVLLLAYVACRALILSRFGRVVRGIRENATRMEAIGFAPFRYQLTVYVISGMVTSVAGFLLANQAEFVSPAYASWQRSGDLIFMSVLGGAGTLYGAILGSATFTLLTEFLPALTSHWRMIFGVLLILVVIFARGGLVSLLKGRP